MRKRSERRRRQSPLVLRYVAGATGIPTELILDPSFMPLWLFWLLLGLIAGSLAKFLMPGRDPAGCIFTIFLGVVGAILGGLIGTQLGWGSMSER